MRLRKLMSLSIALLMCTAIGNSKVEADQIEGLSVSRIYGNDRYSTALEVSKNFSKSDVVVLASGESFPDALSAGQFAGEKNSPLVLTAKNSIPNGTIEEINRLGAKEVIIVGGKNTIGENVEKQLSKYRVSRIYGKDRYETSTQVLKKLNIDVNSYKGKVLVSGENFPDALAAVPFLKNYRTPSSDKGYLLLAGRNTNENNTGYNDVIIGGKNSIRSDSKVRYAGSDRYDTAIELAKNMKNKSDTVILVSGENFPDALSASAYAYKINAPIVLTSSKEATKKTIDYIKSSGYKKVVIVGGKSSVNLDPVKVSSRDAVIKKLDLMSKD